MEVLMEQVHEENLQALLQNIEDVDKQVLRDIIVLALPREGRYLVIWERK